MEDKKGELILCFELRAPICIFDEIVNDMLAINDADKHFERWRKCLDDSYHDKCSIPGLPMEECIWNLQVIDTNANCMRTMGLTLRRPASVTTIQVSVIKVTEMSVEEQAIRLLCHGCLNPLGKTQRRPRYISVQDSLFSGDFTQACGDFGIQLKGSKPPDDTSPPVKSVVVNSAFRQCGCCSTMGAADLFHSCPECFGVVYCKEKCRKEDRVNGHAEWCATFKRSMEMEDALADLPFSFVDVTTSRYFTAKKRETFLKDCGVFGVGLWQREHPGANKTLCDNQLEDSDDVYGLPVEASLLSQPAWLHDLPDLDQPFASWFEYYDFRGFPNSSPVSVLLCFSMTLYHIVTTCLPDDFPDVFSSVRRSKCLTVHLIGAEKEAHMFQPFLECAKLLPSLQLKIHLFGNNLPHKPQAKLLQTSDTMSFQIHHGLYHEMDHSNIPTPDIAVCFNGGIGAYVSYMPTVKLLTQQKVPLYYTDYGLPSITFSRTVVEKHKAGVFSEPRLNPFRSPFRVTSLDQNLPRFSNAFLTCISPYQQDSTVTTHSHSCTN